MLSRQRKPRKRLMCLECGQSFTDDYRNKHNQKYHSALLARHKRIPYKLEGAPLNPFEASKRKRDTIDNHDEDTVTESATDTVPTSVQPEVMVSDPADQASTSKSFEEQLDSLVALDNCVADNEDAVNCLDEKSPEHEPDEIDMPCGGCGPSDDNVFLSNCASNKHSAEEGKTKMPEISISPHVDGLDDDIDDGQDANVLVNEVLEDNLEWANRFPNDPGIMSGTSAYDTKDRICSIGPCQPMLTHYPTKKQSDKMRAFQNTWYTRKLPSGSEVKRDWLEYSPAKDAMYCFACRVFGTNGSSDSTPDNWTTVGVDNWKRALEKITKHEDSKPHLTAAIAWKTFVAKGNVRDQIKEESLSQKRKEIEKNRELLKRLLDIVFFLAKQNLPLRGHRESHKALNRGNFLELVQLIARYDPVLQMHIKEAKQNERYFSPEIQNDFIEALSHTLRQHIIDRIRQSGCYSIIMDETSDCAHIEQVSFVFRYALEGEVYESFLKFQNVESTSAETLYNCLCNTLETLGLGIEKLRGQGYDGASNMSGRYNGLKTKVMKDNPKALYVHCSNHCLNLVLVDACKTSIECKKFFGLAERLYSFIEASPKRHAIFVKCQTKRGMEKPTALKRLSDTRWACHCDSLRVIGKTLPAILDTLEEIADEENNCTTASNASGLLDAVSTFDFIAAFTVLKDVLETIRVASDALQERGISIDRALKLVDDAEESFRGKRNDNYFEKLISDARNLADECKISNNFTQRRPRRRTRQAGELARDEVFDAVTSFKANVFCSSIDTCLVQLQERFSESRKVLNSFTVLSQSSLQSTGDGDQQLESLKVLSDLYGSGMDPDIDSMAIKTEYEAWKAHLKNSTDCELETSKDLSAQDIFRFLFNSGLHLVMPNLYRLYAILCAIPATSVEAERSFSKLKIIKDYRRSTMGQDRLSGLSILSIERRTAETLSFEAAINCFAEMRPRRKKL